MLPSTITSIATHLSQLRLTAAVRPRRKNGKDISELEYFLKLSSAPDDQVFLLRRGILSEFVSSLERDCADSELHLLVDCLVHEYLLDDNDDDAAQKQLVQDCRKRIALEILRNLSRSLKIKSFLFEKPGFVSAIVTCFSNPTTTQLEEKEMSIQIMNNLGCSSEVAIKLIRVPGIVSALLDCARAGENWSVREWAIRAFNNMAFAQGNQETMLAVPGLVRTLIDCMCLHPNDPQSAGVREWSVAALDNLSMTEDSRRAMFAMPELLPGLLACIRGPHTTEGLREKALKALNNLAGTAAVAIRLVTDPLLVPPFIERILDTANDANTSLAKEASVGIFLGLSCPDPNHRVMFANKRLLDFLLNRISFGEPHEIEFALGTLMNLAVSVDLREPLFLLPGLVDVVLKAAETGSTNNARVRENAVGMLDNLALGPDRVVAKMKLNKRLSFVAMDCVLACTRPSVINPPTQMLQPWSFVLCQKLGFTTDEHPRAYEVILALCSVTDVPHLARQSQLRVLSKDMVREIAKGIIPLRQW